MLFSNSVNAGSNLLLFFLIIFIQTTSDFSGNWQDNHPEAGEAFIFNLELIYQNGELTGQHCFAYSGGWDCATDDELTLINYAQINNTTIELDYITGYGLGAESADDFIGRVRLTLIDANTLKWEVISRSTATSLVPDTAIFHRSE